MERGRGNNQKAGGGKRRIGRDGENILKVIYLCCLWGKSYGYEQLLEQGWMWSVACKPSHPCPLRSMFRWPNTNKLKCNWKETNECKYCFWIHLASPSSHQTRAFKKKFIISHRKPHLSRCDSFTHEDLIVGRELWRVVINIFHFDVNPHFGVLVMAPCMYSTHSAVQNHQYFAPYKNSKQC